MKDDKRTIIILLIQSEGNVSKAADIRSKSASQSYRDNWDAVFAKKEQSALN
jgi:hypothetical protein